MIKKIIGNTVIFVFMLGFIVGFSVLFGSENVLIGVTTITAVLMLLDKDFSLNPVKTLIKFICFNVLMGIVTFLSSKNALLGIPLNFIFLFITGYTLVYNLSTPSFVPFNLQYVFMLFMPVTIDKLPKRLIALIVGAIIIVLTQILFNKNKIYKQGSSVLSVICLNIIKKIEALENNQPIEEFDKQIKNSISKFRRFVYNKREQHFYFTDESRIKLNISLELEKIDSAINELSIQNNKRSILDDKEFKQDFIAAINTVKMCFEKDENLNQLDKLFTDMFDKYNIEENISVFKVKILNSLFFIKQSLYELKELDKNKYNVVRKLEEIPSNHKLKNIYKESFRSDSLRFSYAFREALGITISAFIVEFFKIPEGKWIVYTVNSLIQPFYEKSKEKTKDRLIATIIGVLIIGVLYYFVKGPTARSLAIMAIGYLLSYSNTYRYRTINATISAIGAAGIDGTSSVVLTMDRIVFVVIGTIFSVILSKFVFPYKAEDAKRDLIKLYDDTIKSQIKILEDLISKNKAADDAMRNEVLRANMIEDKLLSNEGNEEDKNLQKYIDGKRSILLYISDLYNWIEINDTDIKFKFNNKSKIKKLVGDKETIRYDEVEKFVNNPEEKYSLSSKIAIIDYIEILMGINKVNKIKVLV